MSVYAGGRTKSGMLYAVRLLKAAFPGWSDEQTEILQDRFAEHEFSDQRMIDSIKHVIDTYEGYGRIPNIANFIQYDRRVKLITAGELTALANKGEARWDDYAIVRIEGVSACRSAGGKPALLARIADIEQYGLTRREPKQYGYEWPD